MVLGLPSIFELLVPNLTVTTLLGLVIVTIGIFGIFKSQFISRIFEFLNLPSPREFFMVLVGVGLLLIFGVSALQDFASTTNGFAIIIGIIAVTLVYFIFIRDTPVKSQIKNKRRR